MKLYGILWSAALVATLCSAGNSSTNNQTGQHPHSFRGDHAGTIRSDYLLYLPEGYDTAQKEWPLLLFLHGSGERGDDLNKVAKHGPPKLAAQQGKAFPFVIVSPQCPANDSWTSELQINTLNALLNDLVSRYRIDEQRIYITGLSLGGYGTWDLAAAYPDRFAAIAPVCGRGNTASAASLAHIPAWVFHGAKDKAVPIKHSEEMVAALKQCGGNVKFTIYPDAGHDSWTATYNNPELYTWLLKHTRAGNKNQGTKKPDASGEK